MIEHWCLKHQKHACLKYKYTIHTDPYLLYIYIGYIHFWGRFLTKCFLESRQSKYSYKCPIGQKHPKNAAPPPPAPRVFRSVKRGFFKSCGRLARSAPSRVYPTTWVLPLWMAEDCRWVFQTGVSQAVSRNITGPTGPSYSATLKRFDWFFFLKTKVWDWNLLAYPIEELWKAWHEFRLCLRKQNGLLQKAAGKKKDCIMPWKLHCHY